MTLRANSIVAGYGNAEVLHGIDLEVAPGQALAIVGANGAGKTTLVSAIAGLRPLTSGSVTLNGVDVSANSPDRRVESGLVLCPEGRRILATLSVEENLILGGTTIERRRGARRETRELLAEMYERFPILLQRRNNPGGALSGGQQQLLAIGRALMSKPKVLMLDEPSLGLAPQVISEVYSQLRELRKEGRAIVLVEEGARRALAFADHAIVLAKGSVVL
jgi:branched-chain amino acid transport system ATP-binding protein